jgi:hypothetical protein
VSDSRNGSYNAKTSEVLLSSLEITHNSKNYDPFLHHTFIGEGYLEVEEAGHGLTQGQNVKY